MSLRLFACISVVLSALSLRCGGEPPTAVTPRLFATAEIKRVFTAHLEAAEYRSYLVEWNGAEVVVLRNPSLPDKNLKPGDKLSFAGIIVKGHGDKTALMFIEMTDTPLLGAAKSPQQRPKREIPLTIGKEGEITLDGVKCSESELPGQLSKLNMTDAVLLLRAHPESDYQHTARLVEILKKANITNVTFTSDEEQ